MGTVRPAAALGVLAEPLAPAGDCLFDLANAVMVALVNPAMTLESVGDAALLGGANRAIAGGELLQFGRAEPVAPGLWRLSRLLRGRAGTAGAATHAAGEPFVLLDDPALLTLPDELARSAEGGAAVLQWVPRVGTALSEVAVPAGARALVPLPPVHGQVRADGAGGVIVEWVRCSRSDSGWRDHVDQMSGESREMWRIAVSPAVTGIGPWDRTSPSLNIAAAEMAGLPPSTAITIRQMGDFAHSPPLTLPLT